MAIAQRLRFMLMFAILGLSYSIGMDILFELSVSAPFIVTLILIVGTCIAVKKVKHAARIEGAKTHPSEPKNQSILGMASFVGVSGVIIATLLSVEKINSVLFVAAVELIVFGFMIAIVLLLVFARTEIQTRKELANKTA